MGVGVRVQGVLLAAAAMAAGLGAAAAPPDPAAVVRDAVHVLNAERRGVISFQHVYTFQEHGPGHNKTVVTQSLRLLDDGKLVGVRVLGQVTNGRAAGPQELATLQADLDKHPPADDYRLPLSPGVLQEYRFAMPATPCADCPSGSVAVAFTSLKRDADHADGTIVIDASSHHVLRLDFRPSVLPAHTDSGTISIAFGPVLPDLWGVVRTHEHYTGHMLFLSGWGDVLETDDSYRRLPNLDEGRALLARATPLPQ